MLSIRTVTITCLVAVIICNVGAQESRIMGGQITTIDRAPYAVQFRYPNGKAFCGGTLVKPQYVVTAAHCFPSDYAKQATVVGGVSTITENGVQRKIVSITAHPQYSANTMHSDVAVVKLDQPMTGPNIQPIALCSRPVAEGATLVVSGWGQTSDDGPLSNELRTVSMPVSPWSMCTAEYKTFVAKNMFCGSGFEAKGHCFGDSGGPAIIGNELCGINSFGYKCGAVGHTSAFTDVYKVHSFIANALRK